MTSIPEEVLQKYGLKGVHPAADMFPLLEGTEREAFDANVKEHGVELPVTINRGGVLLDGRNRLLAAYKAGTPCLVVAVDNIDEVAFIITMNLQRRHLDAGQRAMIAEKLANIPHGGDREKQRANLPLAQTSVEQAAKQMQVSPRAVKMARAVRKKAAPGVIEMVQGGEMTLNAAHDTIKAVNLEPEITTEELLAEDSFGRAKRIAGEVRKFDAAVRTIANNLSWTWKDISPESRPPLREMMKDFITGFTRMLEAYPKDE